MGGGHSLFDSITKEDLIVAFFPCIEFSCAAQMWFSLGQRDYKKWNMRRISQYMLNKSNERTYKFNLLYKFCFVVLERGLRMIFENPWGLNTYLKQNVFLKKPDVVDMDRSLKGDFFVKPTAYWFFNCQPTNGLTIQPARKPPKNILNCKKAPKAGLCSEERSMISSDYARNWICDFVIGKKQDIGQLYLF